MLNGVYRFPAMESVVFGRAYTGALAQEVDRLDARAVFVLASGTLARETDYVDRLRQTLGNRYAGVCAKIGAHTPRSDVVAAANMAREAGADLIVTIGGGSVTDAAKMVGLCLGNGVTAPEQLDNYRARIAADRRVDEHAWGHGCEQRDHFVAQHGNVFERVGHLQPPGRWVEREVEIRTTNVEVGGVAFQRAGRGAAHGPVRPACCRRVRLEGPVACPFCSVRTLRVCSLRCDRAQAQVDRCCPG